MEAVVLKIDRTFREAIAAAFYDKAVVIHRWQEVPNPGFGAKRMPGEAVQTVKANFREVTEEEKRAESGLWCDIDAVFTCHDLVETVEEGFYARYGAATYRIAQILRYDSHDEIRLKREAG